MNELPQLAKEYVCARTGVAQFARLPMAVLCGADLSLCVPSGLFKFCYAAAEGDRLRVGRVFARCRRRLFRRPEVVIHSEAQQVMPLVGDADFVQQLGIRTSLAAEPVEVRRWSDWADGGDPWVVVSRFGEERLYRLELLADSDPAWQFKQEFQSAVGRVLGPSCAP